MTNPLPLVALLGVCTLIPFDAATPSPTRPVEGIEWLHDYGAALEAARASGKPILLEFRCAP